MSYCPFRKYSEIFGKVNDGVHSYRVFDIAIVDVISTIIGAIIISIMFKINFSLLLIFLFLLGIVLHRLFCVNTTINKMIFGIIR
jgi:hypothetical protein